MKLRPMTIALYTGLLVSSLHLIWSVMVALGLGQIYLDWILGLHYVTNPYEVMPFNVGTMITLLVFTFMVGFVLGWLGTIGWNKLMKK